MGVRVWLQRLLGAPSAPKRAGLTLPYTDAVELPAPRDLARLIRACGVMPNGSILYLEGGDHPADVAEFLVAHQVAEPTQILRGTIWPRETVYHLPIDAETIAYLAGVAETVAGPELCIHLCVYSDHRVLVSAYDAPGDPVLVNRHLPVEIIERFRTLLGHIHRTR